ncbi:hypothetical protein FE257_001231 [Aspergillus nanangensis]|uniref:catechol O-methyltransferase n=1 Tax=Aspergillus nanangensis TaxID=2582783 RepID=A0AAD4GPW1_ASPNN|nr:hypothetical protein FE257_001231 [Aspergillus nanangensis]
MASETIWHGDGREQALLKHILNHPNASELRGRPDSILSEIDRWALKHNLCMMTIGPDRSQPIIDVIRSTTPKTMAELGGYIGYSAIKFASEIRKTTTTTTAGIARYLSLESDVQYASVAQALVEFAGLADLVHIHVGSSAESLAKLAAEGVEIDVLFIDHNEDLYVRDLRLAEKYALLHLGSVVVADNVGGPRARDYVQMVTKNEGGAAGFKYRSRTLPYVLPDGQQDAVLITNLV